MVEVSKILTASQHFEIFSWRAYGTGSIIALSNHVIVNQIMMLLLWRRHYSMTTIVVMMSAAAIN